MRESEYEEWEEEIDEARGSRLKGLIYRERKRERELE